MGTYVKLWIKMRNIQSKRRDTLPPFHYYNSNKQGQELMNNLCSVGITMD